MKRKPVGNAGTPPKRKRQWGDVSVGALGVALGMTAIGIEIVRNYEFGAVKGPVVGFTYALFAVGLAAVPAVAQKAGWNAMLRTLFAACFGLTGYFGVAYYAQGILDKANAARNATAQYLDARSAIEAAERERAQALGEAVKIAELAAPEQLMKLAEQADKAASQADTDADKEAGNQFCGPICRGHREKADGYRKEATTTRERLALAQAKQAALARASEAQQRLDRAREDAKGGAVEAAPIATLIAMQANGDAQAIAGFLDFAEPVAMVLAMLLFAALIDRSLAMVISGLGFANAPVEAKEVRLSHESGDSALEPKPELRSSTDSVAASSEGRIALFAKRCLSEGECSGAELQEAFAEWWRMEFPGDLCPSMVAVSRALTGAGITKEKRGGRVRYSAGLKQVALV